MLVKEQCVIRGTGFKLQYKYMGDGTVQRHSVGQGTGEEVK
jgi:hypothetical protein